MNATQPRPRSRQREVCAGDGASERRQGDMKCLSPELLRTDPSYYFYVREFREGGYLSMSCKEQTP